MGNSDPLQIVFRTDASIEIGTGHVMRCLTLAAALREQDVTCVFICRQLKGNLIEYIENQGFTVLTLSEPKKMMSNELDCALGDAPSHSAWLGVDWQQDADDSLKALKEHFGEQAIDWLIVDHYALEMRWETKLRSVCKRLMVIDDLADRAHDCDILLDQNLGRTSKDYAELLPVNATILIGPRYALLRPEFASLRAESLARRSQAMELQRILVTMGGIDKDNATMRVLDAIDATTLSKDVQITVVMGAQAPWLETVRERAERMRLPTKVLVGVNNMARLMTDSDLAIGAAGSTTWERCCLGLPSAILILAENQADAANLLDEQKLAFIVPNYEGNVEKLNNIFRLFQTPYLLKETSLNVSKLVDGKGSVRVVEKCSYKLEEDK